MLVVLLVDGGLGIWAGRVSFRCVEGGSVETGVIREDRDGHGSAVQGGP